MFSEDFWSVVRYPSCWWGIRHIVDLCQNIRRVLAYLPIIWGDREWDYAHVLKLLQYKIRRTRDHIDKHRIHTDWEHDVNNMDAVIAIIERILEDDYCHGQWDAFYDKWNPERKLFFEEINGMHRLKPMDAQQQLEFNVIVDQDRAAYQKDWEELWRMLNLHLQEWWD